MVNEFPDYYDDWQYVDGVWAFLQLFKWILNLLFISIPFTFIAQLMLIYNFFFNIEWNQLWAGGNVFLLANTVFQINQTMNSCLIVGETPLYM